MRDDDMAHLQELLHSHSAFDKRMVRFCETGKAVTKERLPGRLLLAPSLENIRPPNLRCRLPRRFQGRSV